MASMRASCRHCLTCSLAPHTPPNDHRTATDGHRVLPSLGARSLVKLAGVRHVCVVGERSASSSLLPGVLLDTPVPEGAPLPTPSPDLCVALYNVSLEALLPEGLDAKVIASDCFWLLLIASDCF